MTDEERAAQLAEWKKWREDVDAFIADSNLYRKATAIQIDALKRDLEINTELTQTMHDGLGEAIPVLLDLKGTARTAKRIGGFLTSRPIMLCVGLMGSVIVYVKTGKWTWPDLP